jgi:hypothetical protein
LHHLQLTKEICTYPVTSESCRFCHHGRRRREVLGHRKQTSWSHHTLSHKTSLPFFVNNMSLIARRSLAVLAARPGRSTRLMRYMHVSLCTTVHTCNNKLTHQKARCTTTTRPSSIARSDAISRGPSTKRRPRTSPPHQAGTSPSLPSLRPTSKYLALFRFSPKHPLISYVLG